MVCLTVVFTCGVVGDDGEVHAGDDFDNQADDDEILGNRGV
jgi:hypothetical protein